MEELETKRLILRKWEMSDLEDFYEYAKDPDVGPNAGWPPHEDIEMTARILKIFSERENNYAIVYKQNGKVIGSIGIHNEERRRGTNSKMLGYVLSKDYWGLGIMPEAVDKVLEYIFKEMNVDLVSCYHFGSNKRSKRVIEKCGFKFEGILRKASMLYTGELQDDYCYSILKEEYLENK